MLIHYNFSDNFIPYSCTNGCEIWSTFWNSEEITVSCEMGINRNTSGRRGTRIGNIYRPSYSKRDKYYTCAIELKAMLQEYHSYSQKHISAVILT